MPNPISSVGTHGRNFPFRKDIVESVIKTTVSVVNGHPLVLLPLEMFDGGVS